MSRHPLDQSKPCKITTGVHIAAVLMIALLIAMSAAYKGEAVENSIHTDATAQHRTCCECEKGNDTQNR